jgi:hypothetical protein
MFWALEQTFFGQMSWRHLQTVLKPESCTGLTHLRTYALTHDAGKPKIEVLEEEEKEFGDELDFLKRETDEKKEKKYESKKIKTLLWPIYIYIYIYIYSAIVQFSVFYAKPILSLV